MRRRSFVALSTLGLIATACQSPAPSQNPAPANPSTTPPPAPAPTPPAAGINPGTRITEAYARHVARDAYFWAWPMINIYNRRLAFKAAPATGGLLNGVLPLAPLNSLAMLHDYIEPSERWVACPNQDVVYGAGIAALEEGPVVVQVPDFGGRFWMYQIVDLRTDSFAELGVMYGSTPGFYLLAGPSWKGETPKGITKVFRASTSTVFVGPRVFQSDAAEDKQAVQQLIGGIDMYPLARFDGTMKRRDWLGLPTVKSPSGGGDGETKWVFPDTFFDELPTVLADATARPGEEARYAEIAAVIAAAQKDPALKKAIVDEAKRAEAELIEPLLQFRNFGKPLPHNWTTVDNGAAFGVDYFTRTAVAKSNILVNRGPETKYFYQDLEGAGGRLSGARRYTMTFAKGELPPVNGFWSLTLYDRFHLFAPNAIKRYSVGTKNKDLKPNADGSLTIHIQADEPTDPIARANWLPAPKDEFSLYVRAYGPQPAVIEGRWTPPAVNAK